MNRQEIDEMMKDLPSQQPPEETLGSKILIGLVFIALFVGMALMPDVFANRTVGYDCRLAEISPDFPVQVRNECRTLQRQYKESHGNQKTNS
jgi:hypothetical protein